MQPCENKEKLEQFEKRISKLERRTDVFDERFAQIMDVLTEIKDSLSAKNEKLFTIISGIGIGVAIVVFGEVILWLIKG